MAIIFSIEVNNQIIEARQGETILATLKREGITLPTLCHMEGFDATGACRLCVVEVEGHPDLVPACTYPVEEWMKISTHSPRVINARKTIVELLLSNHPDDCLYCQRNGNCELQNLAVQLHVRERRYRGAKNKYKTDPSSAAIYRDPAKCILCGRCIRVCDEIIGVGTLDFIDRGNHTIIGPSFNKELNLSSCINCGQCIMVCPTAALHEKSSVGLIQEALHNNELFTIIQFSPTVSITLAEELGIKAGKEIGGIMTSALRRMGFDQVFNTAAGADIYLLETAHLLAERLQNNISLPMITADCPAWVKYAEQYMPDIFPLLSGIKSPQQITGSIINNWHAHNLHKNPESIFSVSVMPCTAKKFEAQREEMTHQGISEVDQVITTRELARLIHLNGINIRHSLPGQPDAPLNNRSSAAKLIGVSGGTAEAILRTLHHIITGKEISPQKITRLRGLKNIKEVSLQIGQYSVNTLAVSGMAQAIPYLQEIQNGQSKYHLIEIMACDGGCINGGGQPINNKRTEHIKTRMNTIYDIDDKEAIRIPQKNHAIMNLLHQHQDESDHNNQWSLFHTNYTKRNILK